MQQDAVKTAKRFSNGALAGAGDADERRKNREIASLHHIDLQISNSIEQIELELPPIARTKG